MTSVQILLCLHADPPGWGQVLSPSSRSTDCRLCQAGQDLQTAAVTSANEKTLKYYKSEW